MSLGRDIELIQDVSTREAVRALALRVQELEAAEAATTDLAAIRAALQRGGSNQLNVTGLVGILAQAQKAQIGVALWQQVGNETGAGNFVWDRELINTVPAVFQRRGSNTEIGVQREVLVLAVAHLRTTATAASAILVNDATLARGVLSLTAPMAAVGLVRAGDRIYCTNSSGDRVGATGATSITYLALIAIPLSGRAQFS